MRYISGANLEFEKDLQDNKVVVRGRDNLPTVATGTTISFGDMIENRGRYSITMTVTKDFGSGNVSKSVILNLGVMATIYKNFTGVVTNQDLITKGAGISGRIEKILISNNNSSHKVNVTVDLFDGGSNTYTIIKLIEIPIGSALILNDNLSFDSEAF